MSAQSGLPKQVLQLAQVKRAIQADLTALTNYTCIEAIERAGRKNAKQFFRDHADVATEVDKKVRAESGNAALAVAGDEG